MKKQWLSIVLVLCMVLCMVPPCALAATAAGADGLIIEVHNDPIHALCDGAQSLRPEEYTALAGKVMQLREVVAG